MSDEGHQMSERDHKKLGKELDLFTFSDTVGKGLPLFTGIRRERPALQRSGESTDFQVSAAGGPLLFQEICLGAVPRTPRALPAGIDGTAFFTEKGAAIYRELERFYLSHQHTYGRNR